MSLIKVKSRGTDNVSGRRNLVHNGAMNVAQRRTSLTGVGAAEVFVCDRWKFHGTSSGRLTATQDSSAPLGFGSSLKLDCTTADTSIASNEYLNISQGFEGQNLQSIGKGLTGAKEFTVSFYVKASGVFTFAFELYDADNARHNCRTFATTTSWVRHSFVIQADEDDGSSPFDNDNNPSMYINFYLHAGSLKSSGTLPTNWANYNGANSAAGIDSFYSSTDNEFFLTGVQIEVGNSASDFEHRSIGEELQLCKRYYQQVTTGENNGPIALGTAYNSAQLSVPIPLHPEMRVTPTVDIDTGSNYYRFTSNASNTNFDSLALDIATKRSIIVFKGSLSGMTGGNAGYLYTKSTSARLAFTAEF